MRIKTIIVLGSLLLFIFGVSSCGVGVYRMLQSWLTEGWVLVGWGFLAVFLGGIPLIVWFLDFINGPSDGPLRGYADRYGRRGRRGR